MIKNRKVKANDRQQRWLRLAGQSAYKASNLASISGVSIRQLERYFQEDFGSSPRVWLNEQRMIAARQLLPEAESVKAVAFDLGFKQCSHFCREFKRYHGIRPSEV